MKVLRPAVTCVLVSHMKPPYLGEALESAVQQTRRDICVVVADSGQWIGAHGQDAADMAALYGKWSRHPLVEWVTTGEPPDVRRTYCPVAWATNEVIRAGLVRGRYMCTFYDDDLYRPRFFEVMAGYLDEHPSARAVWCSQDLSWMRPGAVALRGVRAATRPLGPGELDCVVDGGQVMWRTELLDAIGDPWLPEEADDATCRHSDGIFLERLARAAGVVDPVGEVLCENRKTPLSAYDPAR